MLITTALQTQRVGLVENNELSKGQTCTIDDKVLYMYDNITVDLLHGVQTILETVCVSWLCIFVLF